MLFRSLRPRAALVEMELPLVNGLDVLAQIRRHYPEVAVLLLATRAEPTQVRTALRLGAAESWFVVDRTLSYIGGVIVGRESADQLGGPLRIAQVSGQVASIGFPELLNLTAVLSVSIGLLNLFPIPLLDGGHLLFYGIEAVRGRPLSEKAQEFGFRIGLAIVIDRKSTRLNSSHIQKSRMPSSA